MGTESNYEDQIIHRHQRTSDETSPWDGIAFVEPVGSDSLADQLKRAYPAGKNLRERKHLAAIDFLKAELRTIQESTTGRIVLEADVVGSPSSASHTSQDIPSGSSQHSLSTRGSPAALPISSPRFIAQGQRNGGQKIKTANSTQPFPNSTMQQFVFNSTDGRTMHMRTRKTMTPNERESYTQTRRRGACKKCKKAKAKCTHDEQSQNMTVDTSPKKPSKRPASTPGPEEIETKKILKTEPRIPIDIPMTTVPEDQQIRPQTAPVSPQPYRLGDTPGNREWAPGLEGSNHMYVPSLTPHINQDPNWFQQYPQPGMEPCSPGFPPDFQPPRGYYSPSQYNVTPDLFHQPNPYMSPADPQDNGQFHVSQ